MKRNVGTIDKAVRFSATALIAVLYFTGIISDVPAALLAVVALVLLATGFVEFCPLYGICGISTKPHQ